MRSFQQLFLCAALVATTSTALAQERGPRGFGSPSGAMLLGQKSVQEDLKLSEDQVKQVEEFSTKQRESFSGLRDASREERMKRFNESREAGEKAIGSILNEEQQTRLKQISLQLAGPASFANPEVAEKLAFTDEQKKSIEEIQSANREEMRSLMQDDGDRAEAFRKMQAARQATEEKLKALLSDEQQAKWQDLSGKKFEGRLEGPGGRGFGRGRRGRQGAELRRDRLQGERDSTVLTADKADDSEETRSEKAVSKKHGPDEKNAGHKRGDAKRAHAKHARHRKHGEHASRHRGRSPQARQVSHKHHRGGCEHGMAHRGPHRHHPHARDAYARNRHHGGEHRGRYLAHREFTHRGPHQRHPGFHASRGFDARRHAWHRVALAMGANHRHHGPHHFAGHHHAHRVHDSHRIHHARSHFAHGGHARGHHGRHAFGGSIVGNGFAPRHHGSERAFRHRFTTRSHGPAFGHGEPRLSGFGGQDRPHYAWHFDRHREDGPDFDREHGPRGHQPRMHTAGFKKRSRDAGENRNKDGRHEQKAGKGDRKHGKRDGDKAHAKHKDGEHKSTKKDKDADKKDLEKNELEKMDSEKKDD